MQLFEPWIKSLVTVSKEIIIVVVSCWQELKWNMKIWSQTNYHCKKKAGISLCSEEGLRLITSGLLSFHCGNLQLVSDQIFVSEWWTVTVMNACWILENKNISFSRRDLLSGHSERHPWKHPFKARIFRSMIWQIWWFVSVWFSMTYGNWKIIILAELCKRQTWFTFICVMCWRGGKIACKRFVVLGCLSVGVYENGKD